MPTTKATKTTGNFARLAHRTMAWCAVTLPGVGGNDNDGAHEVISSKGRWVHEQGEVEFVQRAKQAWAQLIRKVLEVHPLDCPVLAGSTPWARIPHCGPKSEPRTETTPTVLSCDCRLYRAKRKPAGVLTDGPRSPIPR